MTETVKYSRVNELFERLDYPVTRDEAAAEFRDVTVRFADGEGNLGELVSAVGSDSFADADELFADLNNAVPVEALGEPGQSEGDA